MEATADASALLRDKARAMFSYNKTSLAGHAVGIAVVEFVFADAAPRELRLGWGAAFVLLWLARAALAWHFARHEAADERAQRRRLRVWIGGTLLTATMWGFAGWSFLPYGDALQQIALILVVYTFCVACVPILSPQFRLYLAFVGLVYLPAIARVALDDRVLALQTALVMLVAMGMTLMLGRDYRTAFERLSRLQRQTEALMDQLRGETAVADAARRDAETANRAKTQFFAAASHDLRQPLHAMGLFAEALRHRSHDAEAARLVNSINASVDALEGLFSELLDITRIDSGGVEVKVADFAVGDLFRRLKLHFEPAAFDKGLALRFRGAQLHGHADPLVVERILRNLLANAIRYTADGGVLVSCRRRGDRLAFQVWDTGPGIAAEGQQRIFEEFYQLPGNAAPTPEQKKGLGLGLAIVKRLAALIGTTVALRSAPGRGSVFGFEVEAAEPPRLPRPLPTSESLSGLTLEGRTLVVVEDEPSVRAGLEVLLQGWGARVLSHDSFAAALQTALSANAGSAPPDLLIIDYRLEQGRNGVDAIVALREAYAARVPAIIVTGSTMTGLDGEAEREDFHLMIKPVVPARLRSMIAFKLGLRAGRG